MINMESITFLQIVEKFLYIFCILYFFIFNNIDDWYDGHLLQQSNLMLRIYQST